MVFKWIKQHLGIKAFYRTSENGNCLAQSYVSLTATRPIFPVRWFPRHFIGPDQNQFHQGTIFKKASAAKLFL